MILCDKCDKEAIYWAWTSGIGNPPVPMCLEHNQVIEGILVVLVGIDEAQRENVYAVPES